MGQSTKINSELQQRVVAFLTREQVDFLDKIGKDALFSKGSKLSRVKIISMLVELMRSLEISGEGVDSVDELKRRVMEKMDNCSTINRKIMQNSGGVTKAFISK